MFSLRYRKLVIFGTLGMPGYAHLKILSTCRKLSCLSADKKQLHHPCFTRDIAKICKLLILDALGMPVYAHPKRKYQLVEIFDVYLHAKNTLHHSLLS